MNRPARERSSRAGAADSARGGPPPLLEAPHAA